MSVLRALIFCFSALVLAPTAGAASFAAAESLVIQQLNGAYVMSVPVSRLIVTIPRGNLVLEKNPAGTAEKPRYFYLEDEAQHLIISGWFESEERFTDVRTLWERETKMWREGGLQAPQAVSFARISDWEAVLYDMALPFGVNSHLRAHWVQAGTWVDLHLSITTDTTTEENRAALKRVLKSIRVTQKP